MRTKIHLTRTTFGVLALLASTLGSAGAKEKQQTKDTMPLNPERVYSMPRKSAPGQVRGYTCTAYTSSASDIQNMRGDELHNAGKDTIIGFEVNPAGFNFLAIEKGKNNKSKASLYSVTHSDVSAARFDNKKYGKPVAAAYMPNAKAVVMATDTAILICEPLRLIPVRQLARVPFITDKLTVSPNMYYVAAVAGDKCYVYNLEQNTLRKELDLGTRITDLQFSPDNSDMAVLTDDGVLTLFSTRTFDMRKMIDNLGDGVAFAYNFDGKYAAVVEDESHIEVVNLLNDSDRESYSPEAGCGVGDITFITDADGHTVMTYPALNTLEARRLMKLKPYYNKLINDEADAMMNEWLKMRPGETMEEYRARVSDDARTRQRRMFEYEISTKLAENLLGNSVRVRLGSYDRANGVLAINFDAMPTIYIPVPENEVTEFHSGADVALDEVLFGVNPDDTFEIVYAKVTNRKNGKSYLFDNLGRATMNYMSQDDAISLETLQQQQMEEIRLQELRQKVVDDAKSRNIISDNTNITVDSRVVADYDADGNKILNYIISFTYDVAPEFSALEDFGPGKYHVEESGAASSMLNIVRQAFEGDLAPYITKSRKLHVSLTGTADATPIVHGIAYDGSYGEFENEPVYVDGNLSSISVSRRNPVKENPQLAFLRALGVKDYLEKKVTGFTDIDRDCRYEVNVSRDKGSEYRRITATFTLVDAF